ncbi:hypothetical protein ACI65C_007217 [Semiaphis heraclei]
MDVENEQNNVFNIRLGKIVGLYQILDPGTLKYRGRNIYHIFIAFIMMYMSVISIILNVNGVYYWMDDMTKSIDGFWKGLSTLYIIYRAWIVIRHSDDIWDCLSITRYDFTPSSSRYRHILDRWRERSVWLTTTIISLYSFGGVLYTVIALVFIEDSSLVKNQNVPLDNYWQNVVNFILMASYKTYNAQYKKFRFVEALYIITTTILFYEFDVLLITLYCAISCQMQIICSAFESVGNKSLHDHRSSIESTDETTKIPNAHDIVYDELKTIIMDHQAVMEKFEKVLTLFGRTMLFQIFISSIQQISLWFFFIMLFSNDDRFNASDTDVIKMIISIPAFSFQIFLVCYFFGNLHDQKESIIFALYSSNWTEMDMKCKKLILLTMRMNNANKKSLKFTITKIVNLEMFFKVAVAAKKPRRLLGNLEGHVKPLQQSLTFRSLWFHQGLGSL